MLLRRTATAALFLCTPIRHHSSAVRNLRAFNKVSLNYRANAIEQAQEALKDYLHSVRAIPFPFAEAISKNSLVSLSNVVGVSKVKYSKSSYCKSLQKFFRYHPVNEFEFFYESIGIDFKEIGGFLPKHKFFLSEDLRSFNAASTLCAFGFPWNRLGMLCKEERSLFDKEPSELNKMLINFRDYGFSKSTIIGICLAFPHVLSGNGDFDVLFSGLRTVIVDYDLVSDVDDNVDAWVEVCRKIRLFYDMGFRKGKIWELMGVNKNIFVVHPEQILVEKIEYFSKFDVRKVEVGLLLLSRPEIFNFDLKSPAISVVGILHHFGLGKEDLDLVIEKYPYVLGQNRLANLPHAMRAMNLSRWLFDKIKDEDHYLLVSYVIGGSDEDFDREFSHNLMRDYLSHQSTLENHIINKLEFLHSIGFGENKLTLKVLKHIHATRCELQDRFDCLIRHGIEFSKLCKIISLSPKILNQQSDCLEKKLKFLCEDMGSSVQYLDIFPAYLSFSLEKRIAPRHRIQMWLTEAGLWRGKYCVASLVATSDRVFMNRIFRSHPAALKKWLEIFTNPKYDSFQETRTLK